MSEIPTSVKARVAFVVHHAWLRKATVDPEKLRAQLQALYRRTFTAEARAAITEAMEAITSLDGPVEASEVNLVMESLERRVGVENLGTTLVSRSATVVRDVYAAGAAAAKVRYKLTVTDHRAIKILAEHDLVWIGEHNSDELMPKFRATTEEVLRTGYSRRKLAEALADELGGIVDADKEYWEALADHTVTKAREIGRVAGFEAAGIETVVVHAILDSRTSAICRDMNGRVIAVKHLRAQADRLLAARTSDELKAAAPWPGRFEGKTRELPATLGLPPYHYRCRTTLFAVIDETPAKATAGARMSTERRRMLERYTPEEHAQRSRMIRARAQHHGLSWRTADWETDIVKARMVKHGKNEFGEDPEAYNRRAQRTVHEADEVLAQVFRGKRVDSQPTIQYRFFCRATKAETVVDDDGTVRGCYPVREFDRHVKGAGRRRLWLKS